MDLKQKKIAVLKSNASAKVKLAAVKKLDNGKDIIDMVVQWKKELEKRKKEIDQMTSEVKELQKKIDAYYR